MNSNIRKLSMLGIPLAAMAVLAVFLSFNTLGSSKHASAAATSPEFTLHIGAANTAGDAKGTANISIGSQFLVTASLDTGAPAGTYDGMAFSVLYSGNVQGEFENAAKPGTTPKIAGNWPDCVFEATAPLAAGFQNVSCGVGTSSIGSVFLGTVMSTTLTCTSAGVGQVSLTHGASDTLLLDHAGTTLLDDGPDVININCNAAPTATPVPPTATPPAIPRIQKDCSAAAGIQTECNVFLQRNGVKVPPSRCDDGTSFATLTEEVGGPINTINPKGDAQDLAAFEFEVRFDPTKVCVNLAAAGDWVGNPDAICTIQDKDSSTLEGIARIGCVTIGKGVDTDGLTLATITVRPQPEVFSQLRPNQDNGNAVQILNQGCELADEQGHAIPIFSCEDADITFRFLEGDVDGPDCDVDVFDTQQVAFRWGVNKGSLLFNSFMDLEPSGQVKGDGDIDIKDIQFVFGRFNSTCANPWPAQLPVNPKA